MHNYFVHRAEEPDRLARLMHKTLDTKYRAAVHASQMARCEESLDAFWSRSVEEGDIPGPYWALLTHPLVTDPLIVRAFGDVHMLSHLTGAANRADARRLQSLESTLAEAKQSLATQATEQRRAAAQHADEVAALERRLKAAEADSVALAAAEARLRQFESDDLRRALDPRWRIYPSWYIFHGRVLHGNLRNESDMIARFTTAILALLVLASAPAAASELSSVQVHLGMADLDALLDGSKAVPLIEPTIEIEPEFSSGNDSYTMQVPDSADGITLVLDGFRFI